MLFDIIQTAFLCWLIWWIVGGCFGGPEAVHYYDPYGFIEAGLMKKPKLRKLKDKVDQKRRK